MKRKGQIYLCLEWKSRWQNNTKQAASIISDKLWRSEIYNSVSAEEKVQNLNLNHSKLKVKR